jgi:hypothetical protein
MKIRKVNIKWHVLKPIGRKELWSLLVRVVHSSAFLKLQTWMLLYSFSGCVNLSRIIITDHYCTEERGDNVVDYVPNYIKVILVTYLLLSIFICLFLSWTGLHFTVG